jgi:predicted CopG family antitoxin
MIKTITIRNDVYMILRNDRHLRVDEQDPIADWLVRSMKSAQRGTISYRFNYIASKQVLTR